MSNKDIINFVEEKRREFEFPHHVIINEKGKSLYKEPNSEVVLENLAHYNGKMLKVVTRKLVGNELYCLLANSDGILGWYCPEDSIEVYRKRKEVVGVDFNRYATPPIHELMNIKGDMHLAFREKKLSSLYYIIDNDEIYEALYTKNKFLGWAHTSHLLKEVPYVRERLVRIEDIKNQQGYEDVQLKVKTDWFFEDDEDLYLSAYCPGTIKFELTQGDKKAWVEMAELRELAGNQEVNTENILMDDLLLNIEDERQQSKNNIIKLIKETYKYREKIFKLEEKNKKIENHYNNLKNSKLGNLQTRIWEKKKRRRK